MMGRYLVVAHETVGNPLLLRELSRIADQDPGSEFILLVPATRVRHLRFRRGTEQDAFVIAGELADRARTMMADHVNLVDARVGPESPLQAIEDEMRQHPGYTGFVISTLPQETSRWLRMDLPGTVESTYGLPVRLVSAPPEWFGPYRAWWADSQSPPG